MRDWLLETGRPKLQQRFHTRRHILTSPRFVRIESQVNLDIATQSAEYEHGIDVEGDPSYFAAEDDEPPVRILARDYERVVEGDPADLGSGIDPVIIRLARLDPDE